MNGWSFCIVTIPENEDLLFKCIEKIEYEFANADNYEIIIVGNKVNHYKNCISLDFQEETFFFSFKHIKAAILNKSIKNIFKKSGAICIKKNLAAKYAKYDKLCVLHDYVGLESGWKDGWDNFKEEWEVAMNVILNKDLIRHRDWLVWDYPGIGACLLPYNYYCKYMYISGTYFCVKKDFFLKYPLNERLFWGEGEDVEWSLRIREITKFKMNSNSVVKYLKLKPNDDAPYCDSLVNNSKLLEEILSK